MPQPGQSSITIKSSICELAEKYVKKYNKKSVAAFVTELILKKTNENKESS